MVGNVSIFTYKKCQHFLSFPLYVNDVSRVYFTSTWALLVFMNKTILITDKKNVNNVLYWVLHIWLMISNSFIHLAVASRLLLQ